MNALPKAEFSVEVGLDDIPAEGRGISFEADERERRRLAERFDLIDLKSLKGKATLKPWRRIGFALEGRFEADVVQACVVTLEPVESRLEEGFRIHFLPAELLDREAGAPGSEREIVIDAESEEPPEALQGGSIDVGEAVAEQLALALDPYPRKPGVAFEEAGRAEAAASEERPNPFAALEKLKKKD